MSVMQLQSPYRFLPLHHRHLQYRSCYNNFFWPEWYNITLPSGTFFYCHNQYVKSKSRRLFRFYFLSFVLFYFYFNRFSLQCFSPFSNVSSFMYRSNPLIISCLTPGSKHAVSIFLTILKLVSSSILAPMKLESFKSE